MDNFKFNVEIKDIEKVNPLFSKCKIYICYADENRNGSDIPKEVIQTAIPTLYNCPILGEYNQTLEDFRDHGGKIEIKDSEVKYVQTTQAYGLIPESSEIAWEMVEDKEYLTCTGFLWTSRYPESQAVIENGKGQSMEIENVAGKYVNKKFKIESFTFSGLTILGDDVEPCFEDAKIVAYTLDKNDFKLEFAQMIQELKDSDMMEFATKKEDYGTGEKIEIDNSKDSANTSGSWGDVNKTSLRNDILKASNYKSLVKEAYLICDDGWEDAPSSKLSYPHHQVSNGKLIVHKAGCEAAFSRLHQQGITSGSAINHIKKHYKELGLDMSNFSKEGGNVVDEKLELLNKYNFTQEQVAEQGINLEEISLEDLDTKLFALTNSQLASEIRRELGEVTFMDEDWWGDPIESQRYYYRDNDGSFVYVVDCADGYKDMKLPYSMQGDNVNIDFENASRIKYTPVDWEGGDDDVEPVIAEFKKFMLAKSQEKLQFEKDQMQTMIDEMGRVHNEKMTQMQATMDSMKGDMDKLMGFKAERLQADKQAEVDAVFAQFSTKLTNDELAPYKENALEMDLEVLKKELFALVGMKSAQFNLNTQPKLNNMGIELPKVDDPQVENQTVWDKYKK